jgi:hypothetical protein
MNIPKLFEGAIAQVLRQHAVDAMPRLRTWQNVSDDYRWIPTNDRAFPLLDIRATPAVTSDDGVTQRSNVSILIATNASDDPSHAVLSDYYEDVQTVIDALYSQFMKGQAGDERKTFDKGQAGDERKTFDEFIANSQPDAAALISVGGFEHGEPLTPYEDSGANFIGINFIVHFSRSDY